MTSMTWSTVSLGLLNTQTTDYATKDSLSTTSGNLDGYSLCGARTYTFSYVLSGSAVTPTFITQAGSVLTYAPTVSADMGVYTVTLVVCLTNYPTICSTKTFTLNVLACIVSSVTKTGGTVASFSHTSYSSAMNTITFPTFTQVPNCGYTITRTAYVSPLSAIPTFMT